MQVKKLARKVLAGLAIIAFLGFIGAFITWIVTKNDIYGIVFISTAIFAGAGMSYLNDTEEVVCQK